MEVGIAVLDERRISRRRFIRLGAIVGLGSAGASIAAACGAGGGSQGREAPTTAGSVAGGPEVGEGEAIVAESELARGSAFSFTSAVTGEPAVLVRTQGGELFAYSAVCTHQRCTVAYREDTQKLVCPCHGSVFDPADGAKVEAGPAPRPLPELPIEVRSGRVFLA
jgi:thiosulfate dehydrogenase [quinone] large subunit